MAHQIKFMPTKTYATAANAVKAVEKILGPNEEHYGSAKLHYFVMEQDGRFFPVFVGERSIQAGVHHHFPIVG